MIEVPEARLRLLRTLFSSLRKNSILLLFLGGAALQRCGKCIVLNPALAAEGNALAHGRLFPQPVRGCGANSVSFEALQPLFSSVYRSEEHTSELQSLRHLV